MKTTVEAPGGQSSKTGRGGSRRITPASARLSAAAARWQNTANLPCSVGVCLWVRPSVSFALAEQKRLLFRASNRSLLASFLGAAGITFECLKRFRQRNITFFFGVFKRQYKTTLCSTAVINSTTGEEKLVEERYLKKAIGSKKDCVMTYKSLSAHLLRRPQTLWYCCELLCLSVKRWSARARSSCFHRADVHHYPAGELSSSLQQCGSWQRLLWRSPRPAAPWPLLRPPRRSPLRALSPQSTPCARLESPLRPRRAPPCPSGGVAVSLSRWLRHRPWKAAICPRSSRAAWVFR